MKNANSMQVLTLTTLSALAVPAYAHPGHGPFLSGVLHAFSGVDQYVVAGGAFLLLSILSACWVLGKRYFGARDCD